MENIEMTNEVLENTPDTEIVYSDPENMEESDISDETAGGGNALAIVAGIAIVGVVSGICWLGSKIIKKMKDHTPAKSEDDEAPKGIKKLFSKFKKNKTEETPEEEAVEEE